MRNVIIVLSSLYLSACATGGSDVLGLGQSKDPGFGRLFSHTVVLPDDIDNDNETVTLRPRIPTEITYKLSNFEDLPEGSFIFELSESFAEEVNREPGRFRVEFACQGCLSIDNTQPWQDLVFNAEDSTFDPITFEFTPLGANASPLNMQTVTLSLIFWKDSVQYDSIRLNACVSTPTNEELDCRKAIEFSGMNLARHDGGTTSALIESEPSLSIEAAPTALTVSPRSIIADHDPEDFVWLVSEGGGAPDVFFKLHPSVDGSGWNTVLEFTNSEIQNAILEAVPDLLSHADNECDRIADRIDCHFPASPRIGSIPLQNRETLKLYFWLSCLIIPEPSSADTSRRAQFRKWISANFGSICSRLQGYEENEQGSGFFRVGQELSNLFFHQRPGSEENFGKRVFASLSKIAEERANVSRSVKLAVTTGAAHFPIQLMHPCILDAATTNQDCLFDLQKPLFVGLVFELSAYPSSSGAPRIPNQNLLSWDSKFGIPRTAMLIRYRDLQRETSQDPCCPPENSPLTDIGNGLFNYIERESWLSGDLSSRTVDDILATTSGFEDYRSPLDLLVSFTHGESRGWSAEGLEPANSEFRDFEPRSRLIVRTKQDGSMDYIDQTYLEGLQLSQPAQFGNYFGDAPIVMLMACETNSPALGGGADSELVTSFLALGAGAVVGTEAEIDATIARDFTVDFIDALADKSPSEAAFYARRSVFEQRGSFEVLLIRYNGWHGSGVRTHR